MKSLSFDRLRSFCGRPAIGPILVAGVLALLALGLAPGPGSVPAAIGPAAAQAAGVPELPVAPHRAVYRLRLAPGSGTDFADISGEFGFEWADSCDGWSVNQRVRMVFDYRGGASFELGWSLTSWEAKDASSYRFQFKEFQDGEQTDELRGEANKTADGGIAVYAKPSAIEIPLPAGTMFPTEHSLRVIEAAMAGQDQMFAILFDGTSADGVSEVSAIMLPRGDVPLADALSPELVEGASGWRVEIAFYDYQSQASEPVQEQKLWMFENGIIDRLVLDLGDFRVLGELSAFELLPEPVC